MKILIGYDGSACADDALADLRHAGLADGTEATVLSAADIWPPRPHWNYDAPPSAQPPMSLAERAAFELAMGAMTRARDAANAGAAKLRAIRPAWQVAPRACAGPPAQSLIDAAAETKADLAVVGTRGRSGLRGLLLGSVSRRVLADAPCAVRVCRRRIGDDQRRERIVLGIDGSENSLRAARTVAARQWTAGADVRVVSALDVHLITARSASNMLAGEPSMADPDVDARTWIGRICDAASEELRGPGIKAEVVIREGDAASALLEEARDFEADCIFVGATGLRGLDRFVLGSVPTAVAEHALCSVEVVR